MVWGKNGTPDTLTSANKTTEITDLTAKTFNVFLHHVLKVSGNPFTWLNYDSDTASRYARRRNKNYGNDTTDETTNKVYFGDGMSSGDVEFNLVYSINIDGEEKLGLSWQVSNRLGTGAGTLPSSGEGAHKYNNGASNPQYTAINLHGDSSNLWATNTNLSALGTD